MEKKYSCKKQMDPQKYRSRAAPVFRNWGFFFLSRHDYDITPIAFYAYDKNRSQWI